MACAGNQTNFIDFSDTSGVTIERWHWNFGDPNSTRDTSTIRNPTYTYDTSGIYNVKNDGTYYVYFDLDFSRFKLPKCLWLCHNASHASCLHGY